MVVLDETKKMLLFPFYVDMLDGSCILKDAIGLKSAIEEEVLRLFMYKCTYLTGHLAVPVPFRQRLFYGDAIALPLPAGHSLSIKAFKEVGYQRTDGQEPLLSLICIDVSLWLKVDVLVLFIQPGIGEGLHFFFYRHCFYIFAQRYTFFLNS